MAYHKKCDPFILHSFWLGYSYRDGLRRYAFFPTHSSHPLCFDRDTSLAAQFPHYRFSEFGLHPVGKTLAAHGFIQAGHLAITITAPEVKLNPVILGELIEKAYNAHIILVR